MAKKKTNSPWALELDFELPGDVGAEALGMTVDLIDPKLEAPAPQSYITWSSEFLDNLIITMNERKELNDKFRDLTSAKHLSWIALYIVTAVNIFT